MKDAVKPEEPLTRVRVLAPFTVGARIAKPGEIVEVAESDARDLVRRGRAEMAA